MMVLQQTKYEGNIRIFNYNSNNNWCISQTMDKYPENPWKMEALYLASVSDRRRRKEKKKNCHWFLSTIWNLRIVKVVQYTQVNHGKGKCITMWKQLLVNKNRSRGNIQLTILLYFIRSNSKFSWITLP